MKSKLSFKNVAIISCVLLAGIFIGVVAMTGQQKQPVVSQPETDTTNLPTQNLEDSNQNYIGEDEAKSVALSHAGLDESNVTHMLCKLDYDDGVAEYEVEFWDGTKEYDYEINAVSGEIISYDYDMESYDAQAVVAPNASTSTEYIEESEAKSIALSHAGLDESNVTHVLCKFDYDDGVAEYEVEFWDGTKEYDYEINAVSGEIISYDYDMESYDAQAVVAPNASTSTEYIEESEAKAIAFAHAGVMESEADYIQCNFDFDDGHAEYEVEWKIDRMEYEYSISAIDGTIWEFDVEHDD